MNVKQRKALKITAAIVLGMLLFPPYVIVTYQGRSHAGYAFLFDPPYNATVDAVTLAMQWVGVLIVGAIAFVLMKER